MKIGIDISQTAYEGGVSDYLSNLIRTLVKIDQKNEYVLFFSGFRKSFKDSKLADLPRRPKVSVKAFPFPPILLDFIWNKLHIFPIELLVGRVDVFLSSDWTEPPAIRASKGTIVYDLVVYKTPQETAKKIVDTQKRKLKWAKKESKILFCISESSKKDVKEILGVEDSRLKVIYPGA